MSDGLVQTGVMCKMYIWNNKCRRNSGLIVHYYICGKSLGLKQGHTYSVCVDNAVEHQPRRQSDCSDPSARLVGFQGVAHPLDRQLWERQRQTQ